MPIIERASGALDLFEDVGGFGGSYKEFLGLYDQFGGARVRDTPVAEAAMVGLGVGAAALGYRPVVSITYMDFLMLGLDPLVNYAAKARSDNAGRFGVFGFLPMPDIDSSLKGIEYALDVAIDRLQGRDAGEFAVLTPFGLICSGLICFVVLRAGEG